MNETLHYRRIFGIKKKPKYLYWLFDALIKQTTFKMKALQVQVYIQQSFQNEHWA